MLISALYQIKTPEWLQRRRRRRAFARSASALVATTSKACGQAGRRRFGVWLQVSALYMVIPPQGGGGETLFASTAVGFDKLDDATREQVCFCRVYVSKGCYLWRQTC